MTSTMATASIDPIKTPVMIQLTLMIEVMIPDRNNKSVRFADWKIAPVLLEIIWIQTDADKIRKVWTLAPHWSPNMKKIISSAEKIKNMVNGIPIRANILEICK